jgi:hypothetical protein
MRSHDMTANRSCAMRAGGAFVEGVVLKVAMPRDQGAIIRVLCVSG